MAISSTSLPNGATGVAYTATLAATVTRIRHRVDIDTYDHVSADTLGINDVARVTIDLGAPIALERYADSRELGGFIMIDRLTNGH